MKVLAPPLVLCSIVLSSVFFYNAQILEAFKPQTSSTQDDLYDMGVKKAMSGQYEEAITYYDKILEIDPDSGVILWLKGIALDSLGKSQEAINYYDKALDLDPNNANSLLGKAIALGNLGQSQEAIAYYDKVLAIDPNNSIAFENKALLENQTNN
jgi:Putative Zn-dependent protease, contains TPR repeats